MAGNFKAPGENHGHHDLERIRDLALSEKVSDAAGVAARSGLERHEYMPTVMNSLSPLIVNGFYTLRKAVDGFELAQERSGRSRPN